jgi:hypothetical protein
MLAPPSQPRFERKFIASGVTADAAVTLVRWHRALFREIYPERAVNNLYLDTPDLRYYTDHLNGACDRVKVRLRWYGALGGRIDHPVLEFKTKHDHLRGKESFSLPGLVLNGGCSHAMLEGLLGNSSLPEAIRAHLRGLQPSLGNRYRRRYFCSRNGGVRLTVDWAFEFFDARLPDRWWRVPPRQDPGVVLELKYGLSKSEEAAEIANTLPFRLQRCSKYILGVDALAAG